MSELLKCPFCDGEVYFATEDYNDEIIHLICCDKCDLKFYGSNSYGIKDHIINQWNIRKPMANIVEKLEERKKYLERAMKESHENGHRFSEEKAMNERVAIRYAINTVKQEFEVGTIRELKALKEKNEPKKPIYSNFDNNGNDEIIPYKAICPVCGYEFNFGSWNEEENHHCRCGQAIDWQ